MKPNNVIYNVYPGDLNDIIGFLTNVDGTPKVLTDTVTYNTVQFHVWQPDGTIIINGAGGYSDRNTGELFYTLTAPDTVVANAGNWEGRFITYNNQGQESDTSEIFNFNIIRAF